MARALGWHPSKLSRIEHGETRTTTTDVRKLLDLYDADEQERTGLVALTREAGLPGWWHEYNSVLPRDFGSFIDLEREATVISTYETADVPGLLQTEPYARAQLRAGRFTDSDEEIERRVEARMARQELLNRRHPPRMRFVMNEGAVRRLVGGAKVMRGQLARLIEIGGSLMTSVAVVPYVAGAHAATVSFALFDFDGDDPPIVYSELLGSSVYVEKPEAVTLYRAAFDDVLAAALSPVESAALMADIEKEL